MNNPSSSCQKDNFSTKSSLKELFFWRSNMFSFSTKSSLKELFFVIRPLVFFTCFNIDVCCLQVTRKLSLQSSEVLALALDNHCNHQSLLHLRWVIIAITSTCNTYEKQSSQSLVLVLLARRKYRKI